ncbi:molybdopterin oxidoreductase family protein [Streptoalloteichus hindustanus]|uniref:Molybdopterin oxidoreductase Fe4S4 domain-containing protein n=1 Tax=Streptoalloteichus hindustanus TaxID=2017 RepID=A0A1M4Z969_STRHI|nr:nitrate reductase [Streptoalloteichus hindustanus]SHF14603.1 Molybdopterin oxidoreductase Fe4S4 domain-containing protein [Streptoalloteichus hindustanus]
MADRIADIWGARTPHGADSPWPVRVDQYLAEGVPEGEVQWVPSACVLCSNGCGMDIAVHSGQIVGVRGRASDRVSHGRLGPKGLFGWQANNSPDRLTEPLVRRDGELRPASWDEAMGLVVERSRQVLDEHGPLAMGFYNSGQLFLEDYYTLSLLVRAGIGTPHLDGNTRLCTATADFALKETFGTDGDPGSLRDFDLCDTIFAVGHNIAETQTVLWARILDRLHGPDRPRLVVVDPRRTAVAREADVHLPIRNGTNLALLNGIQHELIANDRVDRAFVDAHTVGFDQLAAIVADYPPERVAEICGVPAEDIRAAARILGSADRLVSTCLQGVYQSHQATASACQVNNINLLRGMIGEPGRTVFQMNGQPTAQNTRETGANGDMTALRNWQNPDHVADLARIWNVDPLQIPTWAPPTHVMQIFRHAETGSIRFLWIVGTNPAVSLPELHRIRSILAQENLFVVVSDAFLNETGHLADVVLPAAVWGEKTGTFTNHDRTVHLSVKAVDPPGQARPDMDIFLDYATRMELKDKDGAPLIPWRTPEECFEAFKRVTAGRPCDYSGLSYEKLRGSPGIQWPCNENAPEGTERLYADHQFNTDTDYCEDYGHDLATGAAHERNDHAALRTNGRAILKSTHYLPPHEAPSEEFPLLYTTGRTVYHWHTRTKSRRAPQLNAAAPEMWVELAAGDAERLGVREGDLVRVESARGAIEARAHVSGVREGVVFAPFHYGYWDLPDGGATDGDPTENGATGDGPGGNGRRRAANELTVTEWDPVSHQPLFKVAAVRVEKVADGGGVPSPAPTTTTARPVSGDAPGTSGGDGVRETVEEAREETR